MSAAMNKLAVATQRQICPTSMPNPRHSLMGWIGAVSGFVGAFIYNLARSDEMLPINRALLAIVASLLMLWVLILLLDKPRGQR
jgi:hypothetical protein